jgi:hypothetical protein
MAADWAVAGGTGLLALATFALALSARREAKIAAEHVVAIQRPLVTPYLPPQWTTGTPRGPALGLKNSGLGPAYNIEGGLYWTGGAGGASSILRATLAAGEATETRIAGEGIDVNWPAATGYLRYRDSVGEEWQTHFRFSAIEGADYEIEVVKVGTTKELGEPAYSPEGPAHPL